VASARSLYLWRRTNLPVNHFHDRYLRTLLVQVAQHIPGPLDCDLRRRGLKLAERGGRNGKKRAIMATVRKLEVLLQHMWVSGDVCDP